MISIKSEREIELLRQAGRIVHETREYLKPFIKEGITTKELDTLAEEFILSKGATPSFKGLNDFPCATCISINEEVVHGIPSKRKLMEHTKESLFKGLEQIKPGNRIGDISNAIETHAKKYKLGVVRELVGHGVGTKVHEEPDVPNFGEAGRGPVLKVGMVLAVEPMLTLGRRDICILDDDWTIETIDNSPAAHYEHTVVVTKDGYEILTGGKNG